MSVTIGQKNDLKKELVDKLVEWIIKSKLQKNRRAAKKWIRERFVISEKDGKLKYTDDLVLRFKREIQYLPDNLIEIKGMLDLTGCIYFKRLPDNIIIGGSLFLVHCNRMQLPENMSVKGDVYLPSPAVLQRSGIEII